MEKRRLFYTTYSFTPKKDKFQRIRDDLEPLWTMNKLYFNKNISPDVMKKIEEQFNKFPEAKKDDVIDMISQ